MSDNRADHLLRHIRYLIDGDLSNEGYGSLIDSIGELDDHLSAGGTPPEAWREGPDAPEPDDEPRTYSRAEIVNGTGWMRSARFRQILPDGEPSRVSYSRAEIVNGTGWMRSARFVVWA